MIRWLQHPEYVAFLKEYIPGHTEAEIRDAFRARYGVELSEGKIGNFKNRYGIKSGTHGGYFFKGQIPHNKGKKMPPDIYEKAKPTMFQKGHVPKNHKPVGSERINVDGYTEVKIAEPKKWVMKQRLVYEQIHGIKLKPGEVVIFLDGNKQNFEPDNLHKLTRSALARYNQDHLSTKNKDVSLAAARIAELKSITGELRKNEKSAKHGNS